MRKMSKQGDDVNTGDDSIGDKSEALESRQKCDSDDAIPEKSLAKLHTMTVCMVPPPHNKSVWEVVTKARTELKDPGLFRWPPHANLLYPFLNIDSSSDETIHKETLKLLGQAVSECDPFRVALDTFGTFGGKSRGVLSLHPQSSAIGAKSHPDSDNNSNKPELDVDDSNRPTYLEPLIALQSTLFRDFPECPDQQKQGKFTPHMTISHFPSLKEALAGKTQVESWWSPPVEFDVTEIYLLKRVGDDGAFKIVATLPLGSAGNNTGIQVHTPPIAFPDMPLEEEGWVREERMKMKARRNGNSNGRRGRRRSGKKKKERMDRGPSRSVNTPEVIAQKRAERAAKRERLSQEAAGKNPGD